MENKNRLGTNSKYYPYFRDRSESYLSFRCKNKKAQISTRSLCL